MSKGGKIVSYIDASGATQFAVAEHADQNKDLIRQQKSYLRLVNNDFSPKLKDGKKLITVKSWKLLTPAGHID